MRELERRVVLSVLDRKWREHLYEMDYLREGIYLRAYSQRDPLVEYQREGFDMFAAMMDGIKEESVGFLFNLEVQVEEEPEEERRGRDREADALAQAAASPPREAPRIRARASTGRSSRQNLAYSAPSEDGEAEVKAAPPQPPDDEFAGVGRNADCPVRLGQEVQEVPRRTGRPHRADRARQRLTGGQGPGPRRTRGLRGPGGRSPPTISVAACRAARPALDLAAHRLVDGDDVPGGAPRQVRGIGGSWRGWRSRARVPWTLATGTGGRGNDPLVERRHGSSSQAAASGAAARVGWVGVGADQARLSR